MQGDFSRTTFDAADSYRAVLLQQGRVLLDADWNEQAEITAHHDEARTRDAVGPDGGPAPDPGVVPRAAAGPFAIVTPDAKPPAATPWADLRITSGTYYVDGLLAESGRDSRLAAQPHLPELAEPSAARVAVYLDVWTRHVTADEDPRLIEPALGGPDTTTRARTVWQVRHTPLAAGDDCADLHASGWLTRTPRRMEAGLRPAVAGADPCQITGTGGYERLENQLYRVQVHDARKGTFVWSRDNGSVTAALLTLTPGPAAGEATLGLDRVGRDEELSFREKQIVEVTSRDRELRDEPGHLARTGAPAGLDLPVTWLDPATAPAALADLGAFPVVRRWDGGPLDLRVAATDLEAGITVEFPAGGEPRNGDFWTVPARTVRLAYGLQQVRGTIDWPAGPQPPAGVTHHVAPLAILAKDGAGWTLESDCRRLFPPLTGLATLDLVGGDGQEALPGQVLAAPVRVVVRNGPQPVVGARLTADAGTGHLAVRGDPDATSPGRLTDLATDEHGLVEIHWLLDLTKARTQTLTVRRLDDLGREIDAPVVATARLSVADQVAWQPPKCAGMTGAGTVQEALNRLATTAELRLIGGDGQAVDTAGTVLPQPVRVLVDSPCGPVAGVAVQAAGLVVPAEENAPRPATISQGTGGDTTDDQGLAAFWWQPDFGGGRSATLQIALPDAKSAPIRVVAQLDPPPPPPRTPGAHIKNVAFPNGTPFANDADMTAAELSSGVRIGLDDKVDPASVKNKPVVRVELDLPWPLANEDVKVWADAPVGYRTVVLDALVGIEGDNTVLTWQPTERAQGWLVQRLWDALTKAGWQPPLLGRLVVDGWAIVGAGKRHVNGHANTHMDGGRTRFDLPTDDEVTGGVFTQWFRLARDRSVVPAIVVPDVVGRTLVVARREVEAAGLLVSQVFEESGGLFRKGLVIDVQPPAGTELEPLSGVVLVVSAGRG